MLSLTLLRLLLPFFALGLFLVVLRLVRPPKPVAFTVLTTCWVAGLLSLLMDIVGIAGHFWHYTFGPLVFGLPLDFYVAMSLVYGGVLLLLYWWLRASHPQLVLPFLLVLPLYGLLRDYLVTRLTGRLFLAWDSPWWWVADLLSWAVVLWGTILVFTQLDALRRPKRPESERPDLTKESGMHTGAQ